MKKLLVSLLFFVCYDIHAGEQASMSQDIISMQVKLLAQVEGLPNTQEIKSMTSNVKKFQDQYYAGYKNNQQTYEQDNQSIKLLESEVSTFRTSFDTQAAIQNFMENPESFYYHKTCRWSDEMHNLTNSMIRSRAALKKDPSSEYWKGNAPQDERAVLNCLQSGGTEYIYPKERVDQIQKLADLKKTIPSQVQGLSKLSDQCKMLDTVSQALLQKMHERNCHVDKQWLTVAHAYKDVNRLKDRQALIDAGQKFRKNCFLDTQWQLMGNKLKAMIACEKASKERGELITYARQLRSHSQLAYNSMMNDCLKELAQQVACEEIESACYDKKTQQLVKSCLNQARVELEQEQIQAELDAKKAAQNEKSLQDKEKAKAKKERQKKDKQAALEAQQIELNLINEMIEKNKKSTVVAPVIDVQMRHDLQKDLIKQGYKGERLKLVMLDHDIRYVNVMHNGQVNYEQTAPKFLDLLITLLEVPLTGSESLLQSTLQDTFVLYGQLKSQGKELSSFASKKIDIIKNLMQTKQVELEKACAILWPSKVSQQMREFISEEAAFVARLQELESDYTQISLNKDNIQRMIGLKGQIDGVKISLNNTRNHLKDSRRQHDLCVAFDTLQRLQAPEGPFPHEVSSAPMPVAKQIGKLTDVDLQNYRRDLEERCTARMTEKGKISVDDIQPLLFDIFKKIKLNHNDRSELSESLSESMVNNDINTIVLTKEFKQALFNRICLENKKVNKPYDVHLSADLTEVQCILIDVLQKTKK